MIILGKLLHLFKKQKPHEDLLESYDQLHELADFLDKELSSMRELHEDIVAKKIRRKKGSEPTGKLTLEKTLFIKEILTTRLREVARVSEKRFLTSSKTVRKKTAVSPIEEDELKRNIEFLENLRTHIEHYKGKKANNDQERLDHLEEVMASINKDCHTLHDVLMRETELVKEVKEREISPLLKDIYYKSEPVKGTSARVFRITRAKLSRLQDEAARINSCQDKRNKIIWRRWWRRRQVPELDVGTPIKDPHVDVTIKLFGDSKKSIHLVMVA